MAIPRFLVSKFYQAAFVASGVFLGVNNYDLITSLKERVTSEILPSQIIPDNYMILEDLVNLKENEKTNIYWSVDK